jgi:hypothetical protein
VNQSIEDVLKKIKISEMIEAAESVGGEPKKSLAELVTLS